jgi:hypothetical protein
MRELPESGNKWARMLLPGKGQFNEYRWLHGRACLQSGCLIEVLSVQLPPFDDPSCAVARVSV